MLCTISLFVSVTFAAAAVFSPFRSNTQKNQKKQEEKRFESNTISEVNPLSSPKHKGKTQPKVLCKSIWCFNKCTSYIEIKQFAFNWMKAFYMRWSWPVLKNNFPLHCFHPMVQRSVSLFCWLSFIFITTFLFHRYFHFTLISRWASDQSTHWQVFGG